MKKLKVTIGKDNFSFYIKTFLIGQMEVNYFILDNSSKSLKALSEPESSF